MNEPSDQFQHGIRKLGLVLLAGSAVFGYLSVYMPLEEAWRHAKEINYWPKLAVMTVAFAVLVLTFALFSQIVPPDHDRTKKLPLLMWVPIAVATGAGIWLSEWIKHYLSSLGYQM